MNLFAYMCVCVARNNSLSYDLATALGGWITGQAQHCLVTKVCTCVSVHVRPWCFLMRGRKATDALYASRPKLVLTILFDCVCIGMWVCVLWCSPSMLTECVCVYLSYEELHSSSTIIQILQMNTKQSSNTSVNQGKCLMGSPDDSVSDARLWKLDLLQYPHEGCDFVTSERWGGGLKTLRQQ